jgi:hypothetical protein
MDSNSICSQKKLSNIFINVRRNVNLQLETGLGILRPYIVMKSIKITKLYLTDIR